MNLDHLDIRNHGTLEFRELKKSGFIGSLVGYAAVFNSESNDFRDMSASKPFVWREQISPGTFKRSIDKSSDIVGLYQHDPKQILARQSADTLRVMEDERGLLMEMDLVDTQVSRDVLANVQARNLNGMSFAMLRSSVIAKWEKRDGYALRTVTEAKLVEVSIVTFPAYSDTVVVPRDYETFRQAENQPTSTPSGLLRHRQALEKLRY